MNVSFGSKVSISGTRIYNKETRDFVPATLYEYDGNEPADVDNLACCPGAWQYKLPITVALYDKALKRQPPADSVLPVDGTRVFVLETDDEQTAAMCCMCGISNVANVQFLERNPNENFGLAGQTILASIAKRMLKHPNAHIMVLDPALSALDFYKTSCGFKEMPHETYKVEMSEEGMRDFVSRVEKRTGAPIVDIEI